MCERGPPVVSHGRPPQEPNDQPVPGRIKADRGGMLGGHRHVLGRGREPDDVRPMVDGHRLVPRDAQLELRVALSYPVQHLHHSLAIVVVGDGREEHVERCDRNSSSLGDKHAGQPRIELCLSTRVQTRGRPRFPTGGTQEELPKERYMSQKRRSCEWLMC